MENSIAIIHLGKQPTSRPLETEGAEKALVTFNNMIFLLAVAITVRQTVLQSLNHCGNHHHNHRTAITEVRTDGGRTIMATNTDDT